MLQNIRDKSQGWIAKVIIGMMILLMALFGLEHLFQSSSQGQKAAVVNDIGISLDDVARTTEVQKRQLQRQLDAQFDPASLDEQSMRQNALKDLIERELLVQDAAKEGLVLPDSILDQVILAEPFFQVSGTFSTERYDSLAQQMGYSRQQLRERMREDLQVTQITAGIMSTAFVTDHQIDEFVRLARQTRDFGMLTLKASAEAVDIAQSDIQKYYGEHLAQFMTPEAVQLDYIQLNKEDFLQKVQVSEDELQQAYQKEISGLGEQRRAAHILIEVNAQMTDAQALQKIQDIQAQLSSGADFAHLAEEFSQDAGSAQQGGDLGYAGTGVYAPEFEKALYALKKDQVSAPVRTTYGWHLIKLLGVEESSVPAFTQLRQKLFDTISSDKAEQLFIEAGKKLEDSAFEASDLEQPAQELGVQVASTTWFGRAGGGDGLAAYPQVVQAAFSDDVLEDAANSTLLELDPNTVVVVRIKAHKKPEQIPLEAVAEAIRTDLVALKAAELVRSKGQQWLASTKDDSSASTGKMFGQAWRVVLHAARNAQDVPPEVLAEVFRMPKPESSQGQSVAGVALSTGDFVLLRLDAVQEAAANLSAEEKANVRAFLAGNAGQLDFAAYVRLLEEKAHIERF